MWKPKPSLCASCQHVHLIRNKRGSVFFLCRKSKEDPHFAKYPPQPVRRCPGYEEVEEEV